MDENHRSDGFHGVTPHADELARCTETMRALARRVLRDGAAAEDAAQEAWLVALEGARPADVPLRWWLLGVVRNVAWRLARGENRRRRHENAAARPEAVAPTAASAVLRAETHARLVRAVLALDEPYRATLVLHFFEDLRPAQIAVRTGEPAATVRSRLKRGLELLRGRLDVEHAGDRRQWAVLLAPLAWPRPASVGGTGLVAGGLVMASLAKSAVAVAAAVLLVGSGAAAWIVATDSNVSDDTGVTTASVALAPRPERHRRDDRATAVRSESGGTLALTVRDWAGRPIAGARAEVRPWSVIDPRRARDAAPPSAVAAAMTGADGTTRIGRLEGGRTFEVVIRAAGRARAREVFDVPDGDAPVALDVRLVAACRLAGHVRTPAGSAVPGAVVEVRFAEEPWPWRVATDERGRFVVEELPTGTADVFVGPEDGRAARAVAIRLPFAADVDLVLLPRARIEGTVRDAGTRAPLAGAAVRILPAGPWGGADAVVTGPDGRYAIDVTEGSVFLRPQVHLEGWRAQTGAGDVTEVTLRHGATTRYDIDLVRRDDAPPAAPALGVVEGRVLGPGGEPVVGARVATATTDEDGAFRIEDPRAGVDVAWRVEARGFADAELVATVPAAGAIARCDVIVGRPSRVRGTLRLDDGRALPEGTSAVVVAHPALGKRVVPGVVVTVVSRAARVEPDGTFAGEIAWAGPGSFRVEVVAPGRPRASSADVVLVPGTTEYAADVVIAAGAGFSGRVVDAETGDPVADARIQTGFPPAVVGASDPDGRFEITGLDPRDRGRVVVRAPGRIAHKAVLVAGTDAVLRLQRELRVGGVVVDAEGRGIADVAVSVGPFGIPTLTDADGRFTIGELDRGPVRLEIGPSTADVPVRRRIVDGVEAGRTDLRIVAEPACILAGRVVDANGAGVPGAGVLATPEGAQEPTFRATTSAGGEFRLAGLTQGARYGVVAHPPAPSPEFPDAAQYLPKSELGIRADASGLEIRLARSLAIEGVLADEDGRPAAGVRLTVGRVTVETGEGGRFRFEGLHPGAHAIVLERRRDKGALVGVEGGDQVAAGNLDVRLTGLAGATLSGTVVDEDGVPIAGVLVGPLGADAVARFARETVRPTDADGRFELHGLPRKPLLICADANDRVPARVEGAMPGGEPLRIVMRRGFEVRGRLVDANGAPRPRTLLVFEHPEDRWLGRTAFTDEGGRFSMGGFAAATYRVVTLDRKHAKAVEVGTIEPAAQGDVELRIP